MSVRNKVAILVAVCVLAIAGTVTALLVARSAGGRGGPPVARTSFAGLASAPRIVFRSTTRADGYGTVAAVALSDPAGPRGFLSSGSGPVQCDRVYATAARLLCLASDRGLVTTYSAAVYDLGATGTPKLQSLPLAGVPSRARLSRDGTLAATTSFVAGDSYAATTFSTRTVISRVGGASYGSLEDFRLVHQGRTIAPVDRNFWGVTFAADDDTFYATAEWAHHTWLVQGRLSTRTLRTLVEDAECPSLSPDGAHIVYKHRGGLPTGQWRLMAYTVSDGSTRQLAETHSVDDQVEWLTDDQVLYGLPRTGSQAAESDVWSLPIDGSGPPKLLIPDAWS
ncbi:MAG TPA: hypothetical protein VMB79_16695, partial [Jatrophihabitans sp.]|nr:hypothetical protein [Jatrophihabitans sp.]